MFNNLIVFLHFVAGIICLISFLKFKKLLTKISLLVLGLSAITLALVHANVVEVFQVSLFGISSLIAILSLLLFAFSELRGD